MKHLIFVLILNTLLASPALANFSDEVTSSEPEYSQDDSTAFQAEQNSDDEPQVQTAMLMDVSYNGGYMNTVKGDAATLESYMKRLAGSSLSAAGSPGSFSGAGWSFKVIQPAGR
jgi:hypothetical protein